jgi:hypothetical protein
MRLRRTVNLAGLPALLLLCGWAVPNLVDAQSGTESGAEHYTLVEVNGRRLPLLLYAVEDDCEADLVAGTLDLDPANRRYILMDRVREGCAWSGDDEVEERESGRYELDGREIRFRSDRESTPSWLGWATGNTIEIVRGGRAYTYRRRSMKIGAVVPSGKE